METICKTAAETAKRIRTELKAAFPGIKFSVRSETYSMGNSVNISWTNGPTSKAVDLIVKKYEYGRFDGMTDSSSTEETLVSMPDGTVANLGGAKHVFTRREISKDILDRAERDICPLNQVEYKGPNTPVMGNNGFGRWNAGEFSRSILRARDLTKGYSGMRLLSQTEARIGFEDCVEIIPVGEVIAPAPVAATPATEEIAPEILETHLAAAMEIINHVGTPIRTMSAPARRATVAHRCYIRYPSLDRELVMRAVLTVLVCEMTNDAQPRPMYAGNDWDGGQSAYARDIEDQIAADPDQP